MSKRTSTRKERIPVFSQKKKYRLAHLGEHPYTWKHKNEGGGVSLHPKLSSLIQKRSTHGICGFLTLDHHFCAFASIFGVFGHSSNIEVPLDLLASSEGNEPLITLLLILDAKWENTPTGRQLLVIVQWAGLVPEDTSWEQWESLKRSYNLEDKVILEACRDVMNPEPAPRIEQHGEEEAGTKRRISIPKYLDDYTEK